MKKIYTLIALAMTSSALWAQATGQSATPKAVVAASTELPSAETLISSTP